MKNKACIISGFCDQSPKSGTRLNNGELARTT